MSDRRFLDILLGDLGAILIEECEFGPFVLLKIIPDPTIFAAMQNGSEQAPGVERTLIEAIALRRLVVAVYNGGEMVLAPHQIFSRHGELYVSALNTSKNWRSEEEQRLGHYKIAGLSNVNLTQDPFDLLPDFDDKVPNESDMPVFSVCAG